MIKISKKPYKIFSVVAKTGAPPELKDGVNYFTNRVVMEVPAYLEDLFRQEFNYYPGQATVNSPEDVAVMKFIRHHHTPLNRLRAFLSRVGKGAPAEGAEQWDQVPEISTPGSLYRIVFNTVSAGVTTERNMTMYCSNGIEPRLQAETTIKSMREVIEGFKIISIEKL